MEHKKATLEELGKHVSDIGKLKGIVGFDGFVDRIVQAVGTRHGAGEAYQGMETIAEFGSRISDSSGKGTNIELVPLKEKLGGNGPLFTQALVKAGMDMRYIGALGNPVAPVLKEFSEKTQAISLSEPGYTDAVEFNDGKIMLGKMGHFEKITYDTIIEAVGEGAFIDMLNRSHLIGFMNWTMIPHLTDILNAIIDKLLNNIGPLENRTFFFDLSDPSKRTEQDLQAMLRTIKRLQAYGATLLSLNLLEAKQTAAALDISESDDIAKLASQINHKLAITGTTIHDTREAAYANKSDSFKVLGPYEENPVTTTGTGDHYNAGFALGHMMHLPHECTLTLAVAFSGYFVRHGEAPTLEEITRYISSW